jgi:hypothetical protein
MNDTCAIHTKSVAVERTERNDNVPEVDPDRAIVNQYLFIYLRLLITAFRSICDKTKRI